MIDPHHGGRVADNDGEIGEIHFISSGDRVIATRMKVELGRPKSL